MKIVAVSGRRQHDVEVSLNSSTASVADLARALELAPTDAADVDAGLVVDGFYASGDLAVAEAGIHEGAEVRPARDATRPAGDAAPEPASFAGAAELCVVAGLDAGRRAPLTVGSHLVGRGQHCDVVLPETTVSRQHCRIEVDAAGQAVVANLSDQGTFLEGRRVVEATRVPPDAVIEVGSVGLTVRPPVVDDRPAGVDRFRDLSNSGTLNFNRPPRFAAPEAPAPLAVPKEPTEGHRAPFNVATVVAPAAMGAVMVFAFHNALYAMFAGLSPLMMVGNWWESKHRSTRALRRETRRYREELQSFDEALGEARRRQSERQRVGCPDPAEVVRRATAPSVRLWERRTEDDDFLRLSVGVGDVPWQPALAERPSAVPEDVIERVSRQPWLPSVPVVADLGGGGVIGLVGERRSALGLARSLIIQAAVHHGPADLRIAVLAGDSGSQQWDWAKWLPHTRDHRPGASERRLLADGRLEGGTLLEGLPAAAPAASPSGTQGPTGPTTLYVFDGDELLAGRNSAARAALRGAAGPAAGIVLASSSDRLPAVCTAIVAADEWGAASLSEPRRGGEPQALLIAGLGTEIARVAAVALARFEDPELRAAGATLPDLVPLSSLIHLDAPSGASVSGRWAEHGAGFHLRAPVGVSETGEFWLDLDRHGPHGLIGGTTGSGKSELLKTLVAAFASTYPPSELTFGLFDFKGGSTFVEFAALPHTVGMANDLDVPLARRALQCLRAELLQRERLFDMAGVKDLADYREHRNGGDRSRVMPVVPRLVVIIDEFAAMAAELAQEIGALTDLTARGRSLGVHLILATQKPSTAVNAEIRTNTRLRISLQVEDKQDSLDVVGIPDAALIRHKGRGLFRVGQSEVVALQTALSTASRADRRDRGVAVAPFVFGLGQPGPAVERSEEGANELESLVDAIRTAFSQSGQPSPRRPWPDPLPDMLSLSDLAQLADSAPPEGSDPLTVYFALADDPDRQTRYPAGWAPRDGNLLIFGVVGSGTTTALASLGLAFCASRTADLGHLYALDFGSGALAPLEELPHCGAVIPATDRERQIRLIRFLRRELDRRRQVGPDARRQLPSILLLLDNAEAFRAEFEDTYGLGVIEQALRLFADGPDAGIYVAATATRLGGIPAAVTSAVQQRLLLRLSDPNDYSTFGLGRRQLPTFLPGRGLLAATGQVVQVAMPGPDLRVAVKEIARATAPPAPGRGPSPIRSLPRRVSRPELLTSGEVTAESWRLPVGVSDEDLGPASLILYEHEHAIVAGPARSGKSTTLLSVADALRGAAPTSTVLGIACRRSPLRGHHLLDRVAASLDEVPAVIDSALTATGPTLLLVDDGDALEDPAGRFAQLLSSGRPDVHLVVGGRPDVLRSLYGTWTQAVRRSKAGLLLQPSLDVDGELLGARLPRWLHLDLPPGRGFLVCDGNVDLIQVAEPEP